MELDTPQQQQQQQQQPTELEGEEDLLPFAMEPPPSVENSAVNSSWSSSSSQYIFEESRDGMRGVGEKEEERKHTIRNEGGDMLPFCVGASATTATMSSTASSAGPSLTSMDREIDDEIDRAAPAFSKILNPHSGDVSVTDLLPTSCHSAHTKVSDLLSSSFSHSAVLSESSAEGADTSSSLRGPLSSVHSGATNNIVAGASILSARDDGPMSSVKIWDGTSFNQNPASAADATISEITTAKSELLGGAVSPMLDFLNFSQLMQAADDTGQQTRASRQRNFHSIATIKESDDHSDGDNSDSTVLIKNNFITTSQIPLAPPFSAESESGPNGDHNANEGRMILSGIETVFSNTDGHSTPQRRHPVPYRGVIAQQLSDDTFRLSTRLTSPVTVRDFLDVASDPDMLRLWCEPVNRIFTTRDSRSMGASEKGSDRISREHDGEWLEAETSALDPPSVNTSFLYKCLNSARTFLGFPSHGTVSMFVERNRGRLGLTIGPYDGGAVLLHTIVAREENDDDGAGGNGILVMDTVRLSQQDPRTDGHSSGSTNTHTPSDFCGLREIFNSWYLPRLTAYMTQAASSLANLRDMVEYGNTSLCGYDEAADDAVTAGSFLLPDDNAAGGEMRKPLLS